MLQESDLGVCKPEVQYFIDGAVRWGYIFLLMQFLNGKYFDSSKMLIKLLLISGACCFH